MLFALEQGQAFAARSAVGTLLGLVSATAFSLCYLLLAARAHPWLACTAFASFGYGASTLLFHGFAPPAFAAFLLVCASLAVALAIFPSRSFGGEPVAGVQVLRGLALGSFPFATFFLLVALLVTRESLAVTYGAACLERSS